MTKKEIRKIFLERRKKFSNCQQNDISEAVATNFFSFLPKILSKNKLENITINFIHIFLPITSKNEIDTFLIIRKIQKEFPEIKLVVPKVNLEIMQIENFLLEETSILKLNKWDILEIQNGEKVPNSSINIVLLPLLAFDKNGFRVGYGKGFYDKFLEKCNEDGNQNIIKIGLSSENNATLIDDLNEFDQKMDFCITPIQIIAF